MEAAKRPGKRRKPQSASADQASGWGPLSPCTPVARIVPGRPPSLAVEQRRPSPSARSSSSHEKPATPRRPSAASRGRAEEVTIHAIEDLRRNGAGSTTDAVPMTGALWLVAAVAAVRNNDRWAAHDRLRDRAWPAARQAGEGNVMWTVFGPMNVGLHAVSIEMETGEAAEALRLADDIDVSGAPSLEHDVRA